MNTESSSWNFIWQTTLNQCGVVTTYGIIDLGQLCSGNYFSPVQNVTRDADEITQIKFQSKLQQISLKKIELAVCKMAAIFLMQRNSRNRDLLYANNNIEISNYSFNLRNPSPWRRHYIGTLSALLAFCDMILPIIPIWYMKLTFFKLITIISQW